LSQNSIVVSEDDHAMWLKRVARPHMPTDEVVPRIAIELMERLFPPGEPGRGEQRFGLYDQLIPQMYRALLGNLLEVEILPPLEKFITQTKFPHGSRPLVLEGLMYSLRLHIPFLRPVRWFFDRLFFKRVLYMKRVSRKLEYMVFNYTVPKPNSWLSTLKDLKASGKITRGQFKGEITSMLVSSFSLSSALGSALLCLAARPSYQKKIHDNPAFARYFVMEVLRLYPPFRQFGYQQAEGNTDENISGSFATEFMIPVVELHRNSSIWKDPDKFYPERFLDPEASKGFKYMPFGMGKRSCPGRSLSMSLITQAVKYICSDECHITLAKNDSMPKGGNGRLVAFATNDTIAYTAKEMAYAV